MSESKLKESEVQFKYIFDDDYNPIYVNGAQGGVNVKGEIVANFFFERSAIPYSSIHQVEEGNQISQSEVKVDPVDVNRKFIRMVETGVIMNYQTAKDIRDWLSKHIETIEKLTEKSEKQ